MSLHLSANTYVFSLLMSLVFGQAFAQPPTSFTLDPGTFSDGDTIALLVDHGTVSTPARNILSLSITYETDGFTIDNASPLSYDLSQSWLCDDGHCSLTSTLSEDGGQLTIDIQRTNGQSKSGHGEVLICTGIIVQVEDLARVGQAAAALPTQPIQISVYPNPAQEGVTLSGLDEEQRYQVHVLTFKGQLLHTLSLEQQTSAKLPLAGLAKGRYFLRIESEKEVQLTSLLIQ